MPQAPALIANFQEEVTMNMSTVDPQQDIKQLNSFLQDELSAVETYDQCIRKVDDARIASNLTDLQLSHQKRVELLSQKIQELGGEPEQSSGVWGSISKMVEGGAKLFGDKTAISALEQGEDRGRTNYREKVDNLSPQAQSFIALSILPEHERSHEMLNRVQSMVH